MAHWKSKPLAFLRFRVYDGTPPAYFAGLVGGTQAGANINEEVAMSLSTVYACVSKIATTLASLGVEIYAKSGDNVRVAVDHPAHRLTALEPNDRQTSYEFWEQIISSAALYGMGYAVIDRDQSGHGVALHPVPVQAVDRREVGGAVVYKVQGVGMIEAIDMLEITNLHRISPIRRHRDNIGLTKAAQDFGSQYFGNGGRMTGVLRTDTPIEPEQMAILQNSWNDSTKSGGTKVLPPGFMYDRISISPEEAQFIATRSFQSSEICRIFDVAPAIIHVDAQTTYNNVEQQQLMFRNSLVPWMRRIEQEVGRKLIPAFDRPKIYARFRVEDLFRADMKSRSDFYTTALQNGWMNINEVRKAENLNPVDGGETHTVQINSIALDRLGAYSDKISKDAGPKK